MAGGADQCGPGAYPAPSRAQEREDIFESLDSLLSQLPSPPQVRAAAFRALAALPGVTTLSPAGGGQGVLFTLLGGEQATLIAPADSSEPGDGKLVKCCDHPSCPATSRVLAVAKYGSPL
jgi:hypothetical protein